MRMPSIFLGTLCVLLSMVSLSLNSRTARALEEGSYTTTAQAETPPTEPAATPSSNDVSQQPTTPRPDDAGTPAIVLDEGRVDSLLGSAVESLQGENLGRIVDVLVGHGGEVRAAVVDFGGFLGVGTRKVAVSWSTLRFMRKGSATHIIIETTRDKLRLTPEYRVGEPIVIVGNGPGAPSAPALEQSPK